jgi:hypothetical protein
MARGELTLTTDKWPQIMAGKYSRPPKFSTDAKKDADTVKSMQDAGFSKTTAMARVGGSFEDETELKAAEKVFEAAHGITPTVPTSSVPGQPPTPADPSAAPATEDQTQPDASPDQPKPSAWLRRQFARLTAFVRSAA